MTNDNAIKTLEFIKVILALDGHNDIELIKALDVGIFALNNEITSHEMITHGITHEI